MSTQFKTKARVQPFYISLDGNLATWRQQLRLRRHVVLVRYYQCKIAVVQYVPENGQGFHEFQSVNSYTCGFLLMIKLNYVVVRLTLFLADRGNAVNRNLQLACHLVVQCSVLYTL